MIFLINGEEFVRNVLQQKVNYVGDTNTISQFPEALIIWAKFRYDRINKRRSLNPGTAIKCAINWLYAVCKWSLLFLNVRALQLNN